MNRKQNFPKKMLLNELDINEEEPFRSYCLKLDMEDDDGKMVASPFAVIFDISLLGGQMEDYPDNDEQIVDAFQ